MADKRCENGHWIDESWDLCPYCPAEVAEPEMKIVRPRSDTAPRPFEPAPPVRFPAATSPEEGDRIERTIAVVRNEAEPTRRYVVGWLIGLSGASRGESFPIRIGRNVIGRDKRSDVVLTDEQASGHHADLVFRPDERRFILMDHNSTNGTYVDEAEIEPRRDLAGREIIRIGSQRFMFVPFCHDDFHWDEGLLK